MLLAVLCKLYRDPLVASGPACYKSVIRNCLNDLKSYAPHQIIKSRSHDSCCAAVNLRKKHISGEVIGTPFLIWYILFLIFIFEFFLLWRT